MADRSKPIPINAPAPDARRRLRGRNIALALGLLAWIVLIYVITIVKMKGG
ncbi:hypothetical protein KXR53_09595 [Inquilinus limosus]|uniref:hypothetical protein n=1 Tax=Inquilinus limosus TaxID=171674 RepID=UPI003F17982D